MNTNKDTNVKVNVNTNKREMYFMLEISAALDNVTTLRKFDLYNIQVECVHCSVNGLAKISKFANPKISTLDWNKTVNMFRRCDGCRRVQEINIVKDSQMPYEQKSGEFQQFAKFQCVGCKPKVFYAGEEFYCRSTFSHQSFDQLTLKNGSWNGFDETAQKAVGISDFQSRFVRLDDNAELI